MKFDNVRDHSLEWIWRESAAFQRFREKNGCRSRARVATAGQKTSAAAAVRRFSSPVTPMPQTRLLAVADHHLIETARGLRNPTPQSLLVVPNQCGMSLAQQHRCPTKSADPKCVQDFSCAAPSRLPPAMVRTGSFCRWHVDADRSAEPACSEDHPRSAFALGTVSLFQALAFFLFAWSRKRRRSH